MAWRLNEKGGFYKQGGQTSFQKRHEILSNFLATGNITKTAEKCLCSYNLVKKIVQKFQNTGLCEPGNRGKPAGKMDAWKRAYVEGLVTLDPFLYIEEIQEALRNDLNLQNHEVPSCSVICRTLQELDLTRHKVTKVAEERFTQLNMARRQAFIRWRATIDPRRMFFLDETAFQMKDEVREVGRCHTNEVLPLVTPKGDAREKMSVLVLVGYNDGVLSVYPNYGSFNRLSFNYGLQNFLLPLIPPHSYVVMDNASIHNEQDIINILTPINSTLVKLPTYSPDLNPVEMVNGVAKVFCKRNQGLLRQNMPFAIVHSFSQVPSQAVQRFYRKSWQIFV
ncbi:hypothetical protein AC249_AIPGENE9625 [Exaiptasia diaphana]|nr:hypothetical protein AC249_AIPGENE9625 [Exaiptasia diaphana]